MKQFRLSTLVSSIAAIFISSSALAAIALPSGWYLEGNIGSSRASDVSYAPGASVESDGVGGNINLGYKFIPYFATEMGATTYAESTAKINGVKVAKATHYSYDLAGKAILPLSDTGFDFFAKLGLAGARANISSPNSVAGITIDTGKKSSIGAYYGLGADYAFMPNLAGVLQWARAKGDNDIGTLDLYSIGLSYTFS